MLGVLSQTQAHADEMEDYLSSIDRSCIADGDCVIKDVHNCCGYYPQCVNKNAQVNPEMVTMICDKNQLGGICGSDTIKECECMKQKCKPESLDMPQDESYEEETEQ